MAVVNDDERTLTMAPGVGKKLAQRVILELKDKVSKEVASIKSSGFAPSPGVPGSAVAEAAAALSVLGYSQGEISAALRSVDTDDMSVEDIIRAVLKNSLK